MGVQLQHGHSHGLGGGHHHGGPVGREAVNMNVRAALIHVIGDVIQSVGVFVAAGVIYFWPEYSIVDPICTFVFSIIVLFTTFTIMKDALLVSLTGFFSQFSLIPLAHIEFQI